MRAHKKIYIYYAPPFEEVGVYCFALVGLSVGPSTTFLSGA